MRSLVQFKTVQCYNWQTANPFGGRVRLLPVGALIALWLAKEMSAWFDSWTELDMLISSRGEKANKQLFADMHTGMHSQRGHNHHGSPMGGKVQHSLVQWNGGRAHHSTVNLQIFGTLKFQWRAITERLVSFKFRCPWMLSLSLNAFFSFRCLIFGETIDHRKFVKLQYMGICHPFFGYCWVASKNGFHWTNFGFNDVMHTAPIGPLTSLDACNLGVVE